MFCLTFKEIMGSINLPKVCGPRGQIRPMFCLILREIMESINLPKICGPRGQT